MITTILLAAVLLLVIAGSLVVLFILFDLLWRGHDLPTSTLAATHVAHAITTYHPHAKTVYDLGSGHGRFLNALATILPDLLLVGIDSSWIRVRISKLRSRHQAHRVRFVRGNIFTTNLADADVVYLYLWWTQLAPLERMLLRALTPGSLVITNTSYFPTWRPVTTVTTHTDHPDFERLFVYQVPR